jgi:hypothetical protein
MKRYLILISLVLAALTGTSAYYTTSNFFQAYLIEVSATFFSVAVGVVVVNIYLDRASRIGPTKLILALSHEALVNFHNTYLGLLLTKFGRNEIQTFQAIYVGANGDPKALSPNIRSQIYEVAKSKENELTRLLQELENALSEITALAGWDLDTQLLENTLKSRTAIRGYRKISFDDSDDAKEKVTEALLDIDIFTAEVHGILIKLGGFNIEDFHT